MKTYSFQAKTALPPDALYRAITAIERWPEWDHELKSTEHSGPLKAGTTFFLTPKGGPQVKMEITAAERPCRFGDVAHLPFAAMHTDHRFEQDGGRTLMTVTISVSGPLAFVWDRLVARKQAAGAAEHARAFLEFAENFA
jgi:ligand-binding SRPBCC domain-containing protein